MVPQKQGKGPSVPSEPMELPSSLQDQQPREGSGPSPLGSQAHLPPPPQAPQTLLFFGEGERHGPLAGLGRHTFGENHGASPSTEFMASPANLPRSSFASGSPSCLGSFGTLDFPASGAIGPPPSVSRACPEFFQPHGDGGGAAAAPSLPPRRPRPRVRFSTTPPTSSPHSLATCSFNSERPRQRREQTPYSQGRGASPEKASKDELAEDWLKARVEPSPDQSLPPEGLYAQYCRETDLGCLLDPTAFHKTVRTGFPGISVKRSQEMEGPGSFYVGIARRSHPAPLRSCPGGVVEHQSLQNSRSLELLPSSKAQEKSPSPLHRAFSTAPAELQTSWSEDLSSSCATFALGPLGSKRTREEDHLEGFLEAYRWYLWTFIEAVIRLDFRKAEGCLAFWGGFSQEQLGAASQSAASALISELDEQAHQRMLQNLVPDPLLPIPTDAIRDIRRFAQNYERWLAASLNHAPPTLAYSKLLAASGFSKALKRRTSLNFLSGRAASLLSHPEVPRVMLESWNSLDYDGIRDQVRWSLDEDGRTFETFYRKFPRILCTNASLREWASWFEGFIFNRVDMGFEEFSTFATSAKRFLLSWNFFGSLWIRDLTLRSSAGFGPLHIFKLFLDELLMYILENRREQFKEARPSEAHGTEAEGCPQGPSPAPSTLAREPFSGGFESTLLPSFRLGTQHQGHPDPSSSSEQPPPLPGSTLASPHRQPGHGLRY